MSKVPLSTFNPYPTSARPSYSHRPPRRRWRSRRTGGGRLRLLRPSFPAGAEELRAGVLGESRAVLPDAAAGCGEHGIELDDVGEAGGPRRPTVGSTPHTCGS